MSNDNIPSEEIVQDIYDTKIEIATMKKEVEGLRMMSDRMSHFRADARVSGIAEREAFVAKLERILNEREFAERTAQHKP